MVKGFCGTWLRACIGWCIERMNIRKGLKSRSCEGYYTCSWLHTLMAWLERYIEILGKEDASIGYRYSLDTVTGYRSMWNKLQRVRSFQEKGNPSFQKAYTCCITICSCTYGGCIIDRAHAYACCRTTSHVPVVFLLIHVQLRYILITR